MKYNIGQEVALQQDIEVQSISGKHILPKGTKGLVMADKDLPAIRLEDGKNFYFNKADSEALELVGYDTKEISAFIYKYLSIFTPLDDMLDDYDMEADTFKGYIVDALEELGFYEGSVDD